MTGFLFWFGFLLVALGALSMLARSEPLAFLLDPANHQRHSRIYEGSRRYYYAMPYGEYYIWGATAGMIVNLYEFLGELGA